MIEVTRPADIAWLYAEAFNARDLSTITELFAEDADFVNAVGLVWRDRASIVRAHERALETRYAGARAAVEEVLERPVGDGARVVVARWRLDARPEGSGPPAAGRTLYTTLVLERGEAGWRIVTAHSTELVPPDTGRDEAVVPAIHPSGS